TQPWVGRMDRRTPSRELAGASVLNILMGRQITRPIRPRARVAVAHRAGNAAPKCSPPACAVEATPESPGPVLRAPRWLAAHRHARPLRDARRDSVEQSTVTR